MGIVQGNQRSMHYDLTNVGLRAQATAAGLVQLCIELQRLNILDDTAVGRIKNAIADEIITCASRPVDRKDYRRDVRSRLDRLFAGEEKIGIGNAPVPDMSVSGRDEC